MYKKMLLMLCVMLLVGCAPPVNETTQQTEDIVPTVSFKPEASIFPFTARDATGEVLNLPERPKRVVSLAPVNTEIVYALGAGETLVGRHAYDDYPAEVSDVPVVTSNVGMSINVEEIIALEPDVVLAHASYVTSALSQLRKMDIPVYVVSEAQSISETYDIIWDVAQLLDRQKEALRICEEMNDDFRALSMQAAELTPERRKKVLYEVDSVHLFVAGASSFITELLSIIGADNVTNELDLTAFFPQLSEEALLTLNPDVIVTTGEVLQVTNRKSFADIRAVKENRVYQVEQQDVLSRTGPRLPEGAKALGQLIYPEIFAQ
ncbi:ABC transporter substrate-binding protein [Bacillus sp. FSL W7-1360]